MSSPDRRATIRALNDQLRTDPFGGHGRIVASRSVHLRGSAFMAKAIAAIAAFDGFDRNNDPHGEHDFGIVTVEGAKLYFKIDYLDREQRFGSEDPSDPNQTVRVMTIMRPEDY